MTIDRNELTDQLEGWLGYQQKGYFISLNSVVTLDDMTDQRLRERLQCFEAQVGKLMGFLTPILLLLTMAALNAILPPSNDSLPISGARS